MNKQCCLDDNEVVLHGGKSYCQQHLAVIDTPVIIEWLPTHNLRRAKQFLHWAFGTVEPTMSMFPKLYDKCPIDRGKWLGLRRGFSKPQEVYIAECFVWWLANTKGNNEQASRQLR